MPEHLRQDISTSLDLLEDSRGDAIWIHLRSREEIEKDLTAQQQRLKNGEYLPLGLILVAVKDNIDVSGLPTTAGCPAFSYIPKRSATVVQRLIDAGAVIVGKTNLDQFATGLVGTRTPYGIPCSALDDSRISGGSSSGSAVAVARGLVDISLGTDTAGSGRVPAAFNGIIGIKPTPGLLPLSGVVPAAESFDTVSVFARDLNLAGSALRAMIDSREEGDGQTNIPTSFPCSAPESVRLVIPLESQLIELSPQYRDSFNRACDLARSRGMEVVRKNIHPLLEASRLLYDAALVAERYTAVGEFIEDYQDKIHPVVRSIILAAKNKPAWEYVSNLRQLQQAKQYLVALLHDADALLLPTTTEHPTIDEILENPVDVNKRLGTYTNFANLLGTCACAIPTTHRGDGGFGVMLLSKAHSEQIVVDLAARLLDTPSPEIWPRQATRDIAVFGAHMRGEPLHSQLEKLEARFAGEFHTATDYRMVALNTIPPKPAVVRAQDPRLGTTIIGERYRLSPVALASLMSQIPEPMALSPVEGIDGEYVTGFTATADACSQATDITEHKSWRTYIHPPAVESV